MRAFLSPRENVKNASWIHLTDEEEVLWTGRPSRFTIAYGLIGGLTFVIAGLGLAIWLDPVIADTDLPRWVAYLPLVLTVVGGLWAAVTYLEWLRLLYVITDEEIYVKYGLVSRDVTQIRLDRVQNTTFDQSVVERFFGYGDVDVYTAGSGTEDITFRAVPHPHRLTRLLTETLSERSTGYRDRRIQRV